MMRLLRHAKQMRGTMRFRLVAALVGFLLLTVIGVGLAVGARTSRDRLLLEFSSTWTGAQAAARLEHCISFLHRQTTLLAQSYGGGPGEGVTSDLKNNFGAKVADCESELPRLEQVPEQKALLDAKLLLGHLRSVVDKLGVEHVEAIRLLAVEVDPRAENLASDGFPVLRTRQAVDLERLQGEIGALGRRGDQTLLVALVGPLLAFALMAGLLLRRVLHSLNSLAAAMRALGEGHLTHRVRLEGHDEFSDLATQINTMASQLAGNQLQLTNYANELELSLANLREAQRAAVERQKLAALGELVAGVAHEVNTPLGVAITCSSLAHERVTELRVAAEDGTCTRGLLRNLTGEITEILKPLEDNLARAARLISSFKQVAVDRATVLTRVVQLEEWALAVGQSLAPVTRHHRLTVAFDVPRASLLVAAGELEQILTNLIMNACLHAYSEASGSIEEAARQVKVTALVDVAAGHFSLTVRDNGVGMPADVAARVYEPFFTTRRGRGGSGLGMHIVHQIVHERFGGSIEVETAPGAGTTWRLSFPMPTEALAPEGYRPAEVVSAATDDLMTPAVQDMS